MCVKGVFLALMLILFASIPHDLHRRAVTTTDIEGDKSPTITGNGQIVPPICDIYKCCSPLRAALIVVRMADIFTFTFLGWSDVIHN